MPSAKSTTIGVLLAIAVFSPGCGVKPVPDKGLLGRPLKVGIVQWPGYAGGIVANNGFRPTENCIFWKRYNLQVQFELVEEMSIRSSRFANGSLDVVWSTVDSWASELPGLLKGEVKARAFLQVDWSRGGDAIVAISSIRSIEDLDGKRVALGTMSPSHWLLEYSLEHSRLDDRQQKEINDRLIGKDGSPQAREVFVSRNADAAVIWEPDVSAALKRNGAHIVFSTRTAGKIIADVMVAREDFMKGHPEAIEAFIRGWLDGTEEAQKPNGVAVAVKLLMENEPLYKVLGEDATKDGLHQVQLAGLRDNTEMFGLDGKTKPLFDVIFKDASRVWANLGYITPIDPSVAKDDSWLRKMWNPSTVPPPDPNIHCEGTLPERMRQLVDIQFKTNSADLDPRGIVTANQVADYVRTQSNACIVIEGNTDSTGNVSHNEWLSQVRAAKVKEYLVSRYRLNKNRLLTRGNGSRNAVCTTDTPECLQRNRRTDILVTSSERGDIR